MQISRRDFLKLVSVSAATLGLSALELGDLEKALANPSAPTVIWLQGAGCTGCSVSFLNRISTTAPLTAGDVLINSVNLVYHPNLMSVAGQTAVTAAQQAYNAGNYILIVEGGVPTAFNGSTCLAWTFNGVNVTFKDAVTTLASRASKVVCVGTCAAFGGMSAAPPNPTGVKGVKAATGKTTINIAGCPPHPDWIVWAIVQLLLKSNITLDANGRPTALYSGTVHSKCPRRGTDEAGTYGVDNRCLRELGCKGPETVCNCPAQRWNNGVNWCIDANSPCLGCTNPTFPGSTAFYSGGGD
ncbi:MAG TPA: hydrogenase small subunit [Armatimonadota bacterium]|jgi:hydrogenase small subunit